MKKNTYLKALLLLAAFIFFSKNSFAQIAAGEQKNQKTVIYKLYSHGTNPVLSQAICDNIDKMFTGKKGVLSSKTNSATWETTVKMLAEVPEKDLIAIFSSQKIEVKKITVTDNQN